MTAARFASARPSLSTWLFVCVTAVLVAVVLTCTLLLDRFGRDEAHVQATRYLQANADALRDALDRGMAQHFEEVHVLSRLEQVARARDPAAARAVLEDLRASFPQLTWIGLTDATGNVVAAADGLLEGKNVSARPWFMGARDKAFVGDVHRAVLLEKLLPAQSEPWRFVDIAVPIKAPDGALQGVLGVHLSWTWAAQIKRELVDREIEQHQAEALVLSADGTVLLGDAALQGKKLDERAGVLKVTSATRGAGRYPGLGWQVVLRQPEAVAMASFHALQRRVQWAAVFLCVLLAPLMWLLSRRLASPLLGMTAALEDGRTLRPPHRPLYREAEVLGHALVSHAERQADDAAHLRQLNASLQDRVAERTEALAASEQRLRDIADNMPALIAYFGADQRCQFANAVARRNHGITPERLGVMTLRDALGARYDDYRGHVDRALQGQRARFEGQADVGGRLVDFQTHFVPDLDAAGHTQGLYVLSYDVTAMKAAEEQLILMARTDTLTGLPNRLRFNEKLTEALARSRRRGQPIALLFLDVDKFKSINDTHGHAAGDEVLKVFATRLQSSVRETDTVARLAGDEFVVILEDLHAEAEAQFVARKILAAIGRPFEVLGRELAVSTSIGIAFQHDGRAQPAQLLSAADKALYEAKAERNTYCLATS